jgi:hypothetical protein
MRHSLSWSPFFGLRIPHYGTKLAKIYKLIGDYSYMVVWLNSSYFNHTGGGDGRLQVQKESTKKFLDPLNFHRLFQTQ